MRIIVTTSDRYAHILPEFARAFARAWPDCPWMVDVLWMTHADVRTAPRHEIRGPGADNWEVFKVQDIGWAGSLLQALGRWMTEPFLLLLDDYILDAVNPGMLLFCAQIIEQVESVGMVRVHPVPGPTLPWTGGHGLGRIDKAAPYAISLQAAMWRPQVIRDLFRADEDPWQTEIQGSRRAVSYDRYDFIGTQESALGYRELMKRGAEIPETRAWIGENL